jgi:hypothetical protein
VSANGKLLGYRGKNFQTSDFAVTIGSNFFKAMGWTPPHLVGIDVPN